MPIKIPATLPAHDVLRREGVMVMSEETALRQDIRPLQIGLVNLMPKKVQTETQFARLIGATPLQIELTLIRMSEHQPKNTSAAHLEAFYQPFRVARERQFDGLIVTGAPIEHLEFEAVSYWHELRELFDWTQTNVHSTMGVCWGGMAMLHHFHGTPKHMLPAKAFGCFRHRRGRAVRAAAAGLLRQLPRAGQPLDRGARRGRRPHAGAARPDPLRRGRPLPDRGQRAPRLLHVQPPRVQLDHAEGGVRARPRRRRTRSRRRSTTSPTTTRPQPPENRWRSHGQLLYGNWINEIYQTTPYELEAIGG